jgi:hypothetical protein
MMDDYYLNQLNTITNDSVLWSPGFGCTPKIVKIISGSLDPYVPVTIEFTENNTLTRMDVYGEKRKFFTIPNNFNFTRNVNIQNIPESNGSIFGDFSFLPNDFNRIALEDAFDKVSRFNTWEFIKKNDPKNSDFWKSPDIQKISYNLSIVHTRESFISTMMIIYSIAVQGWNTWVEANRS